MSWDDFYDIKTDNDFWGNLSDCKIGLYSIDPIFNYEFNNTLKAFDFAFNIPSRSAIGCLESCIIDLKLSVQFDIYLLVALCLIWSSSGSPGGPPGGWAAFQLFLVELELL